MNKAVIMAGGFGTRLRPLTMTSPKPMAPVANKPMMHHIVNLLKHHGVSDIVSLLYFQPDKIKDYFKDGSEFDISMKYVTAEADYGTAGSVKNAYQYLTNRFIIISGDVLTDFDITKALEYHEQQGSMATILLTRVTNPIQFGIVMTDDDGKITRFLEKPSWGQVFSDTINTGIYILEPEVLDLIPYQKDFDFSKDLFPLMLRNNLPLYGYICEGYWRDIGNLNEYQQASLDILSNTVSIEKVGNEIRPGVFVGSNCTIGDSVEFIGGSIIGDNVTIENGATVVTSIIGDNCHLKNGSKVTRSVIWNGTTIGHSASVTEDVLCNNITIGDSAIVNESVFIADGCSIGENSLLHSNIKLWPNKVVEPGAILNHSLVQEEKWVRELFNEARITGLSNIDVVPEFAAKLGVAIGNAFGQSGTILASRDGSNAARMIKRTITSGLLSTGITITDLQSTSIPQTRQELTSGNYIGGFHVRTSPRNPHNIDIILFSSDGRDIQLSRAKQVERFYYGEDIRRASFDKIGTIVYPERTLESYIARFVNKIDTTSIIERNFKIVVDYSYGLGSNIFPSILGKLNCSTLAMNNYVDANKYTQTNAHKDKHTLTTVLQSLQGYELGFQIDPGVERISVIDETGTWIENMRLLTVMTALFLETHRHLEPYSIAVPIQASSEIDVLAAQYNVTVIRIKNSHSAMMEETRNPEIQFVGGTRGGFIFPEFMFAADSMFTIAKVLEMLSKINESLATFIAKLPKREIVHKSVLIPWESKGTVMRKAMQHTHGMQRELVDGVKVFFDKSSVILYPERELASFAVLAESDSLQSSQALCDEYCSLIHQWITS